MCFVLIKITCVMLLFSTRMYFNNLTCLFVCLFVYLFVCLFFPKRWLWWFVFTVRACLTGKYLTWQQKIRKKKHAIFCLDTGVLSGVSFIYTSFFSLFCKNAYILRTVMLGNVHFFVSIGSNVSCNVAARVIHFRVNCVAVRSTEMEMVMAKEITFQNVFCILLCFITARYQGSHPVLACILPLVSQLYWC